jgi:glyoxylase-like metal-dependent hydrolase (beta-lactamase superfamily II)
MTTEVSLTTELSPGLHRIALGFVNTYLIEDRAGLTLVDAGFPVDTLLIAAAIEALGHDPKALSQIVITHDHLDHIGSAAELRELTGASILMSEIDATQIRKGFAGHAPMQVQPGFEDLVGGQLSDPDFTRKMGRFAGQPTPTAIEPFEVAGHLVAGEAVPGIDGSLIIPTPGHCAGQVSILVDRGGGWLLTGDAAVNFGGPPAIAPVAEDLELARASFDTLRGHDFELAAFGHGEPITRGAGAAFRAVP